MIFSLDEDHLENNATTENAPRNCVGNSATLSSVLIQKPRPRSPLRLKSFTTHRHKHVRTFLINLCLNLIFKFDVISLVRFICRTFNIWCEN